MHSATAIAHPNIALIKYWGNKDPELRLPSNSSISMNLAGLFTQTHVSFEPDLTGDRLVINNNLVTGHGLHRVNALLDRVRRMSGQSQYAQVSSQNNFPTGVGIASSASAFAALSLAASSAAGLELDEKSLSRLARTGSGSACRSIPGGFVEWQEGDSHESSYAFSLAPPEHWNLTDCVAVVSKTHKLVGSTQGHTLAPTSPLQVARVADALRRLDLCRAAILGRDFEALAEVVEQDSNIMHAVMMTSTPPLIYWQPATLEIMHSVQAWRQTGLPVCYTIDAGPNVHVICPTESAHQVIDLLRQIEGVEKVLSAPPGGPAHQLEIL